ncbi:uncharacterized protein PHALS_15314 [Plasmopara halstedii]|uniref:Uncharacterized protein n=1 Tax=Plasmopara halstedii TaxID=4781 RepID=A0A0P1AU80_PLAHL|nr:uncharacterized protein PHALS_15314 [Plasmopara halstedii]CEG44557.1 hypothetical protein PHALS_15314 [Plasmopara halstedii]|eukprot:XP_024580926.1 hypothetical protein PHALS_15314 [Plasmopara halstedii]
MLAHNLSFTSKPQHYVPLPADLKERTVAVVGLGMYDPHSVNFWRTRSRGPYCESVINSISHTNVAYDDRMLDI